MTDHPSYFQNSGGGGGNRPPLPPANDFTQGMGNFKFLPMQQPHSTPLPPVPGMQGNSVITEQPMFGSQISNFGRMMSQQDAMGSNGQDGPVPGGGVPLPGLDILDRVMSFGVRKGGEIPLPSANCSPSYKIFNNSNELILKAHSDTLFCPFDSKQKSVYVKDMNDDCIFHVKFTPSICECDSEEKRCFAVFSPVFDNPFGAILFEAGQLKYSLKILNALEAETFAVQFMGSSDVTVGKVKDIEIKGADGTIVAIINIHRERCRRPRFTLTLMEEVSAANKALFIACAMTLDLVACEGLCTKCICFAPIVLACLAILGVSIGSLGSVGGGKPPG